MTDSRDELVDVMAEALFKSGEYRLTANRQAESVLAALISRYGKPKIEYALPVHHYADPRTAPLDQRRLVFPWQAVKEGDQ